MDERIGLEGCDSLRVVRQRGGLDIRIDVQIFDEAIHEAQKKLWEALRVVAEPGGAAAFAALLSGSYKPKPGERVGVVVSGGNTVAVNFDSN